MTINELKKFVDQSSEAEQALRKLAGELSREQFARLGWDLTPNETEADTKLRSIILSLMTYAQDKGVTEEALRRFTSTPIDELDPNTRVTIMATAVREASDEMIIDDLLESYKQSSSSELRFDISAALTSTKDEAVIRRLLEVIKDDTIVRKQDAAYWFTWLLRNKYGRTIAWQWLRDNWTWIETHFSGDKSYDSYPRYVASSLLYRPEFIVTGKQIGRAHV